MTDSNADQGSIVTVTGSIDPDDLGVTLPHEHVFFDGVDVWYTPPSSARERQRYGGPISLENRWWIERNPFGHEANLSMQSFEIARRELDAYRRHGGDAIVDVTPRNLGGDPVRTRQISAATGVSVVHGTGYYTRSAHPSRIAGMDVDDIADDIASDVMHGIGNTDVRAGIIGEIGLSGHIHPDERAVLRAAGRAAVRTGAPVTIHPPGKTQHSQRDRTYPTSRWGLDVLDILEEEGLSPSRVVIGHLDRSLFEDRRYHRRLAERGAFLEYDLWGRSAYLLPFADGYPSDTWRVETVLELIDAGYAANLLLSHDVASKITHTTFGGGGYTHLLDSGLPRLRLAGVSEETIEQITVDNPRRLLTFVAPE